MPELLIAGSIVATFLALLLLHLWLAWHAALVAGVALVSMGLAVGVPAGVLYHVHLAQAFRSAGHVPRRWWLNPTAHHAQLSPSAWRRVRPWFYLGVAGFAVTVLGCFLVVSGLVRAA